MAESALIVKIRRTTALCSQVYIIRDSCEDEGGANVRSVRVLDTPHRTIHALSCSSRCLGLPQPPPPPHERLSQSERVHHQKSRDSSRRKEEEEGWGCDGGRHGMMRTVWGRGQQLRISTALHRDFVGTGKRREKTKKRATPSRQTPMQHHTSPVLPPPHSAMTLGYMYRPCCLSTSRRI